MIFDDLIRILSWDKKRYLIAQSNYLQPESLICRVYQPKHEAKLLSLLNDKSVIIKNKDRIIGAFPYLIKYKNLTPSKVISLYGNAD